KFRRILEVLKHLLANHKVASLGIAVTDVVVDHIEAAGQSELAEHPMRVIQRKLAYVEADAARARYLLERKLGINAAADADLEKELHVLQSWKQQFAKALRHVVM